MADPVTQATETTLEQVHQAITDAIKAQFPDLVTVEFYREDRDGVTAPACLLDLTEMDNVADDDPGTGQLAMDCRFEAEIILGFRMPGVKLEARKLAAAMAVWLRWMRWPGVLGGPVEVIGCYKDQFNPKLDQYEVWRVEWHQVILLGVNEWANVGGIIPTTVLGSWVPDIGTGNADKYVPIVEAAEGAQP
jgi:hypothetical protein